MFISRKAGTDDVREAIFQAAVGLFARRGYFATTIRDIVEKAGVTQPMVYYYFGNKEQLFLTCVRELYRALMEMYEGINPDQPFAQFLNEFITANVKAYREYPEAILLVTHFLHSPEEYPFTPEIAVLLMEPIKYAYRALDAAKTRGEIAPELDYHAFGMALFGALEMAVSVFHIGENHGIPIFITPEELGRQLERILIYGVLQHR